MPSIALLTENETIKEQVEPLLLSAGFAVQNCMSNGEALLKLSQPGTRLLLVDGDIDDIDGDLLTRAARALPHEPAVRLIHGSCKPLRRVESGEPLVRLARRLAMPELSAEERQLIELQGISMTGKKG